MASSADPDAGPPPLVVDAPRAQAALPTTPFDRWSTPSGEVTAEFHRLPDGFLVRFPGQVDFEIDAGTLATRAFPGPTAAPGAAETLFANAIVPVLGNHRGILHLHASAVRLPQGVIAFLGASRSGKTTLAAAFARDGYPWVTEDVLELRRQGDGYLVIPKATPLRLFADSAGTLLGPDYAPDPAAASRKMPLEATERLPFATAPAPLLHIYTLLPPPGSNSVAIRRLGPIEALTSLARQAFVLDVDDRARLAAHFSRLGDLADAMPCSALDYPRDYSQLKHVTSAILQDCV